MACTKEMRREEVYLTLEFSPREPSGDELLGVDEPGKAALSWLLSSTVDILWCNSTEEASSGRLTKQLKCCRVERRKDTEQ